MAHLVLAYPELNIENFEKIQSYRKINDELFFNVVNPHFTLVFPVLDFQEEEFAKEIKDKSADLAKVDFILRCATINKDAFSDYFHTFLVPDEGYSGVVKLHDKLYSGKLKNNLRLDLDFIPHIGIGNSMDKYVCKRMVDEWNELDFSISGRITHLTIAKYENNVLTQLEDIELK